MARRDLSRGDIRWFRFLAPDKRRPVLVLGGERLLRSADQIPVIPFSTQIRGLPWEVRLKATEGLGVDSVLKPEWIRSVSARELGPWICGFPAKRWDEVRVAVLKALGLDIALD
jgi:mRNA interferase MazF